MLVVYMFVHSLHTPHTYTPLPLYTLTQGALAVDLCTDLTRLLLSESCVLPVYRTRTEWLHPLFETHVRPGLLEGVQGSKNSIPDKSQRYVIKVIKVDEWCMFDRVTSLNWSLWLISVCVCVYMGDLLG